MTDLITIFENLETIYVLNVAIELFGAAMAIFATVTILGVRLEKGLFQFVLLAYISTFIAVIGDAAAALCHGIPAENARLAIIVCNYLSMIGLVFSAFFYANILFCFYKKTNEKWYRFFHVLTFILGAAIISLLLISQFTGWIFYIDESNEYRRGPLFSLAVDYAISLLLCVIIYMIPRFKKMSVRDILTSSIFILIPIVGALFQWFFYEYIFAHISALILMASILFRIQLQSTRQLVTKSEELAEKEIDLAKTREQLLLSQVRPHFIYNTLTAMQRIEGNPPETIQAIDNFAKYLRQNLSITEGETVIPIAKEIEHVQTYVAIEKLRFGDELNVNFDIQDENFQVPILSVQVLVENAIKHGVTQKRGGGTIVVTSFKQDDKHIITIVDDGIGFDPDAPIGAGHIGINSTKNRLSYYVKGDLKIESKVGFGTKATIIIPENTL